MDCDTARAFFSFFRHGNHKQYRDIGVLIFTEKIKQPFKQMGVDEQPNLDSTRVSSPSRECWALMLLPIRFVSNQTIHIYTHLHVALR